ncbi:hypothetical protein Dfri01_60440 [Dyadobacter frigoris]|nr:hypothetical protein Dfri01_60440 [Dyadobacter frigoris]
MQLNAAPPPIYPYKCFIKIRGSKTLEKGYLYSISDSIIFIAKTYKKLLAADSLPDVLYKFPISNQLIQICVRNRSAGSVGGFAGFGTGLVISLLATKNVSTDIEGAFVLGLVVVPLVCIGAAVAGALVANASSIAVYNHGYSSEKALVEVNSYSYVNWIAKKKKK